MWIRERGAFMDMDRAGATRGPAPLLHALSPSRPEILCGAPISYPASILSDSIGFRWNIRARLASAGDSQMMEMSHVPPFLADTPRRPSACRLRFANRRDQQLPQRDLPRRRRAEHGPRPVVGTQKQ